MKLSFAVAVLLAATVLVCTLVTAETPKEQFVVEATDADIDTIIARHPLAIVLFYAPWCQHSKKIDNPFREAAAGEAPQIFYARIDATENKEAAKKFKIKAFPTIKFFRNGKWSGDYDGERSAEGLQKFTSAMKGSAVSVFQDRQMFSNYLDSMATLPFVVCFDTLASDTCKLLEEVADTNRNQLIQFHTIKERALAADIGYGEYVGKIVVFKQFDTPKTHVVAETSDVEKMRAEIQMQSLPTFGELNPDSYRIYFNVKLPMVYLFINDASLSKPADKAAFNVMRQLAPQYKGRLTFVHIDASKYQGLAQRVGLAGDKFPAAAIDNAGAFYAFDTKSEITSATVGAWVEDYLKNKLTRVVRSDPAPAAHTVDGLTTVVGATFDKLVHTHDEHDHVFVQFHAPFCMHCKEMAPAFAELAKKMKDEDVTVARFDATTNDYDKSKFPVSGFPTMFFIKKNEKPVEYTGGRSLEEMLAFLREKLDA